MALILDKAHTGVTSVDISGNTLTTGYTNLTYEDQFGNIQENPYLVIDNVLIDKLVNFVKVIVSIYKDENTRVNQKTSLSNITYSLSGDSEIYDTYFSVEILESKSIFTTAYDFIQAEYYQSWKSDEI